MAEKEESQDLKQRFTQDLETAKKFMDPIHQKMDMYYELYRNRWATDTDFQISDLYAYVETVVPILTNNRVRASVHSDYPEYIQHAAGLNDILDHTYDINNWDYKAAEIARTAEIYRSAIAYTGFDAEYKNGTGRLCIKPINIRWCYLDPAASDFEESSFFFYVEPKRKTQVIKMYPKQQMKIEESVGKRDTGNDANSKGRRWFQTLFDSVKNYLNINGNTAQQTGYAWMQEMSEEEKRKNSVAFIHYWYRDENDEWRVSYWADDVFLEDLPNPFYHGRLPYDIYNPTKDILSSMGIPMGEHLERLNWEKNVIMQAIIDNADLHSDPPLVYNTTMGLKDPDSLREKYSKNKAIPINNPDFVPLNAIVDTVQVPTMPGYVIDMPDRLSVIEDRITGVNDSFRGMADATSGKEVQLKQEAAYTRIKTKIDNFEMFNKNIAEKIIVNAMQFYEETRAFRIKGDYTKYQSLNGETPFEVEPIKKGVDPQTGEPVHDRSEYFLYANPNEWTKTTEPVTDEQGNPVYETGEDGQPVVDEEGNPVPKVKEAYRVLQMTVEIEAGSSLPVSRLARREEALELAAAGMLDQEAVLESYDWPKRDEVIKRMAQAAQAQQQAQMQMEMAKQQQAMQMEQMKLNAQLQAKQQQQPQEEQVPDIAAEIDALRQKDPRLQELSDEEIMALLQQAG